MKKIINWTFGSVFRTFGRVFAYILIGALFALVMSKSGLKITDIFGIETIHASSITIGSPSGWAGYWKDCMNTKCTGDIILYNTGLTNFGTSANVGTTTYGYTYMNGAVFSYNYNVNNTYQFNYRIHLGGNNTGLNFIINNQRYKDWVFQVFGYKNDAYSDDYIKSANCSVRYDDSTSNGFLVSCNVALNTTVSRVRIVTRFDQQVSSYIGGWPTLKFTSMRNNLISVFENEGQQAIIDNQTNILVDNNDKNTDRIIENQDKNFSDVVGSMHDVLGNKCPNLFDPKSVIIRKAFLETPGVLRTYDGLNRVAFLKVEPGQTYTISREIKTGTFRVGSMDYIPAQSSNDVDYNIQSVVKNNDGYTITYTPQYRYLLIHYGHINNDSSTIDDSFDSIMVVKGTMPKMFCEYGTYTSKLDDTNNELNNINNSISDTKDSIDDLKDSLLDDSSPSLSGLSNSTTAGWLPAGPLDSVLNLPLTFLNSLITGMSGSCAPLRVPLPYVNMELPIPCMSSVYSQMGFGTFFNWVGNIAAAFILFSYLLKLYKYVDDTLTFRENNFIDNWSGV